MEMKSEAPPDASVLGASVVVVDDIAATEADDDDNGDGDGDGDSDEEGVSLATVEVCGAVVAGSVVK